MNDYHRTFNIICGVVRQRTQVKGMPLFDAFDVYIISQEILRLRSLRERAGRYLPL